MEKRGFLPLVAVIVIVLVAGSVLIGVEIKKNNESTISGECKVDSDCVPDICCHATSCFSVNEAPVCDNVACTLDCEPGTLDCGQKSCECVNKKCEAISK